MSDRNNKFSHKHDGDTSDDRSTLMDVMDGDVWIRVERTKMIDLTKNFQR